MHGVHYIYSWQYDIRSTKKVLLYAFFLFCLFYFTKKKTYRRQAPLAATDSHRNPPASSVILSSSPRASSSCTEGAPSAPPPGGEAFGGRPADSSMCAAKDSVGASACQNPSTPLGIPILVNASTSCRQLFNLSSAIADRSCWGEGRMSSARSSQRSSWNGRGEKRLHTRPRMHMSRQVPNVAIMLMMSSETS